MLWPLPHPLHQCPLVRGIPRKHPRQRRQHLRPDPVFIDRPATTEITVCVADFLVQCSTDYLHQSAVVIAEQHGLAVDFHSNVRKFNDKLDALPEFAHFILVTQGVYIDADRGVLVSTLERKEDADFYLSLAYVCAVPCSAWHLPLSKTPL